MTAQSFWRFRHRCSTPGPWTDPVVPKKTSQIGTFHPHFRHLCNFPPARFVCAIACPCARRVVFAPQRTPIAATRPEIRRRPRMRKFISAKRLRDKPRCLVYPGHRFEYEKMSLSNRALVTGNKRRRRRWTNLFLFHILTLGSRPQTRQKNAATCWIWVIILLLFALLFVWVWKQHSTSAAPAGGGRGAAMGGTVPVTVATATKGSIGVYLECHRHRHADIHRHHYCAGHGRDHGRPLPRRPGRSQGRSADRYRFPAL